MKKIAYLLSITLVFTACEDMSMTVDLEMPEHEPLLVVNSIFRDVDIDDYRVYVTHSVGPLSSDTFQYIDDANVLLKEGDLLMDTLDFEAAENFYFTSKSLEQGKTYHLEVSHPNYPTASAEVLIPTPVEIQSVVLGDIAEYTRELQFTISDPEESNYYLLKVGFMAQTSGGYIYFDSDDPSFEGKDFWGDGFDGRKIMFNDQLFNGLDKEFSLDIDYWEGMDSIKVFLHSVSESYYKYHESRKLQNQSGGSELLGAEPVVVYNNIQNGFGVFAATSLADFVVAIN